MCTTLHAKPLFTFFRKLPTYCNNLPHGFNVTDKVKVPFRPQLLYFFLSYLLTYYFLEQLTGSQPLKKFPAFMEPEVSLRLQKCPQPVPILSQLNPVHNPTSHFLMILLNVILPSTQGSPKWLPSSGYSPKPCMHLSSPHTCYVHRPPHSSIFDPNNVG